jgi:hypothetical protein
MGKSIALCVLIAAISSSVAQRAAAQERHPASNEVSAKAGDVTSNEVEVRSETLTGPAAYLGTPFARELSESARAALLRFGPWAAAHGYVGHLSPDQSVLYFALARRVATYEMRLVDQVETLLDEWLPEPRSRETGPITGTGGPARRVYPLGGEIPIWKHDLEPVNSHCGVLFELETDADHMALVEFADVANARHLGEPGRSFFTPEVGAWLWRVGSVPDAHQLVQGAAQHVLERRFPHLPEWLRDGLAWHVERDVLGSVRCLLESRGESSRDFALEWETAQRVRPLEGTWVDRLARFERWEGGKTHVDLAGQAFVFTRDLLAVPPQQLANAAEELRVYWEDHSVRHDAREGWQRITSYRTPVAVQGRVLAPLLDEPRLVRGTEESTREQGE